MTIALSGSVANGTYNLIGARPMLFTQAAPLNVQGELLILTAAWTVSAAVTSGNATIPSASVADNRRNWWRQIADTGNAVPGARIAAWVCANAQVIDSWISVFSQGYVSALQYAVHRFSGLPANHWPHIDVSVTLSNKASSSLVVSGTAGEPDVCVTAAAIGTASGTAPTLSLVGAGWTGVVNNQNVGGTSPNNLSISTAWGAFGAGSVPATWNSTASGMLAAITVGVTQASYLPNQPNPNFPRVFVEAAFGDTPGDPTTALLDSAWTDLSSYAIGPAGQASIEITRGRQYELATPESGTITIGMNNQTGAFNPQNTLSPFFPNVRPGVPIRVSAQFSGRRYPLAYGWVERWPQDWPDMPQWGWSKLVATDAVGVASSVTLPSAIQGEILADEPYYCFPFSEQYSKGSASLNGVQKTAAEASGQPAVNTSRINQKNAIYLDGGTFPVLTGQSLVGWQGDSGTVMGTTAFTGLTLDGIRGPGAQYGPDPSMPLLAASGAGDITVEWWMSGEYGYGNPASDTQVPLFTLYVAPYQAANNGISSGQAGAWLTAGYVYHPADTTVRLFLRPGWGTGATILFGTLPVPAHIALVIANGTVTCYVDGGLTTPLSGSVPAINYPYQPVASSFGLSTYEYDVGAATGNYALGYATLYPYAMPQTRAQWHSLSGITGFSGDNLGFRVGRYAAWARLSLGFGGPASGLNAGGTIDNLRLAQAYSTAGNPMAAALNSDTLSSGGLWYADPCGNIIVLPRPYLYNLPTRAFFTDVFGGAIADQTGAALLDQNGQPILDQSAGGLPYDPATAFDYDNTYISNAVEVTLTQGPNTLAVPVIKDQSSINQYFLRGPLTHQVSVQTVQDALDRAWWSLNKYKQPALRVRGLLVKPASAPNSFITVLTTDLADVLSVIRNPLSQGGYNLPVQVGKVQHNIGPGLWDTTYQAYPYTPENAVLLTDSAGFNVLGSNVLAW